MADGDRGGEFSLQVELGSAVAELAVLRKALETARDEARSANVAARRAERVAVDARRSAQKWRQKCKSAQKEHQRVTSSLVWRIYWPLDRLLHRARSIFRRGRNSGYPAVWPGGVATREDDGHEGISVDELPSAREHTSRDSGVVPSRGAPAPIHEVPDLTSLTALTPRGRIAVVLHLYYPELWPEFREALTFIPEPFDLFVTLTRGYSEEAADWIRIDQPSAKIISLENRGRDILPFVALINSGVLFKYELICKLHTKRSIQQQNGDTWRHNLIAGVLSDPNYVPRVLAAFDAEPELGVVVGEGAHRKERNWSRHVERVNELCSRIALTAVTAQTECPGYPAGSIYWIRSSLLRPIARLNLVPEEFEPEPLPRDGCMVDAIERIVGHICREAGMYIADKGTLDCQAKEPRNLSLAASVKERVVGQF
jgi:Rhamnan synthesis protein F